VATPVREGLRNPHHNAGGYSFYKHPEHRRVTRFRPNGVPLDRSGHYVYLRTKKALAMSLFVPVFLWKSPQKSP
jgi:cellobiose phosphorylase